VVPIGAVSVGAAVQGAGLIPTIVGMGVLYVAVTIGMFFNPALRGMDIRHEPGETMSASGSANIH